MLTKNDEIMLDKIKSILDEIYREHSKIFGKRRKTDGTVALYVEFGSSAARLDSPHIKVEIISYSLAHNSRETLFIFDSIADAYKQVEAWYKVRKKELKELANEDRVSIAKNIQKNGSKVNSPLVDSVDY